MWLRPQPSVPSRDFAVYAATKAYVYSLSLALGEELKEQGILVTVLCPGPVDTEFFNRSGRFPESCGALQEPLPDRVVRQGLLGCGSEQKTVSVYGNWMKAARLGAKLVPGRICARRF